MLVVLATVAGAALVALLCVSAIVVVRNRQAAVGAPNIAPLLSLPPIATPPPASAVHPLPAALPTGSAVAGGAAEPIRWRPLDDGTVRVTPNAVGVDVSLLHPGQREWVPLPLSTAYNAVRIDATVTVTHDSAGNRVGLACRTAQGYGATFSIDSSGEWFMSLDWSEGPTLIDNAQSAAIHPPGTANTLSVVCAQRSGSFEMMYALNGIVVADQTTPLLSSDALHPAVYLCSCEGTESMTDHDMVVSTLGGSAAGTP